MSKPHKILATLMKIEFKARCIPGQMRLPKPKGSSKVWRRGFRVSRNRSGRKLSGDGNISGSG